MKNKTEQLSVLIPEANSNFLPFIVNCLFEIKGVNIYIVSNNINAEIKHSRKIVNYSYYPKESNELEWISNINNELKKFEIDVLMPIDEYGIETLIKHKDLLVQMEKLVFLPSLETFYIANDKGLLAEHLLKHQIPTPKSFLIKSGVCVQDDLNIKFPVLAKPTLGFGGGKGIKKFESIEDFKSYFEENKLEYDFLIEEYIEGYDLGCNVLCKNGELLAYTMQRGTLWSDQPFSPQIGLKFFYNQELYNLIKKLIKSLSWDGVANIDIRFDTKSKQFLILEINPRFWETTEASEIAGVNFPYLYCLANLNKWQDYEYKHVKFLNLLGLAKTIKINKIFIFNFNFIFNNTSIKYYIKDPKPLLLIIYYKIKNLF